MRDKAHATMDVIPFDLNVSIFQSRNKLVSSSSSFRKVISCEVEKSNCKICPERKFKMKPSALSRKRLTDISSNCQISSHN